MLSVIPDGNPETYTPILPGGNVRAGVTMRSLIVDSVKSALKGGKEAEPPKGGKSSKQAGASAPIGGRKLLIAADSNVEQGGVVVGVTPNMAVDVLGAGEAGVGAQGSSVVEEKKQRERAPDLSDLERMLENDVLDLINMKRDITDAQKEEMNKAYRRLLEMKKEHDALYISNNIKEKELNGYHDKIKVLDSMYGSVATTSSSTQEKIKQMTDLLNETNELINMENRTAKMLAHMSTRLTSEISETRIESSKLEVKIEQVGHELAALESTLRLSKLELAEQERQLSQMIQTMKERKEERAAKMAMMSQAIASGEASMKSITNSFFDPSNMSKASKSPRLNKNVFSPDRTHLKSSGSNEPATDDDFEVGKINLRLLNPQQVREMVDRYKSRGARLEKLEQLEKELQDSISLQKEKKEDLTNRLMTCATKHNQLASSRQVYQEVDMKDAALATARKEFDECKEREHRLRINLESLKRALPRFLTKMTKSPHEMPTDEHLSDYVHKLEDEISKLIKTVDTALLKEATVEDLAAMSSQQSASGPDQQSEIVRLQKLPGFSRLQRQLFFNLMSARPDTSDSNVRIAAAEAKRLNDTELGQYEIVQPPVRKNAALNSNVHILGGGAPDSPAAGASGGVNDSLDRATIKKISKLIVERDASKGIKNPFFIKKDKNDQKPKFKLRNDFIK